MYDIDMVESLQFYTYRVRFIGEDPVTLFGNHLGFLLDGKFYPAVESYEFEPDSYTYGIKIASRDGPHNYKFGYVKNGIFIHIPEGSLGKIDPDTDGV